MIFIDLRSATNFTSSFWSMNKALRCFSSSASNSSPKQSARKASLMVPRKILFFRGNRKRRRTITSRRISILRCRWRPEVATLTKKSRVFRAHGEIYRTSPLTLNRMYCFWKLLKIKSRWTYDRFSIFFSFLVTTTFHSRFSLCQ